jgi:hypothetical protein
MITLWNAKRRIFFHSFMNRKKRKFATIYLKSKFGRFQSNKLPSSSSISIQSRSLSLIRGMKEEKKSSFHIDRNRKTLKKTFTNEEKMHWKLCEKENSYSLRIRNRNVLTRNLVLFKTSDFSIVIASLGSHQTRQWVFKKVPWIRNYRFST